LQIRFVGHAAILIETKGLRILSDPWWQGPCFGRQWWIYPLPHLASVEESPIDYIYISHGHADHFHHGTLRRFPAGTNVLVSSELDLTPHLKKMGFDVIEVRPDEVYDLGRGVQTRITPTHGNDTLMVVTDGMETCINLNDALHAAPDRVIDTTIDQLRGLYPKIDYVFCGYGVASHFPNCFVIPGKDYERSAAKRQHYFNRRWAKIVNQLAPANAFPFAADVVFLENELFWANEPVHNSERPTDVFVEEHPDSSTQVIDIAPGFLISDGEVIEDVRFEPICNDDIFKVYREECKRASSASDQNFRDVDLLVDRLSKNARLCRNYLTEFNGDYRFLIILRGQDAAINMVKTGSDVTVCKVALNAVRREDYDLIAVTYYSYLRRAFTMQYGDETLFVGSGISYEYRNAARVPENLHRELAALLRPLSMPPRSRYGDQPKFLHDLKNAIKTLIGRKHCDLYDLNEWTVYQSKAR
jgi:hypothetical protein